jgi:alpha-beta hydrolase superfamily lysophospholipase
MKQLFIVLPLLLLAFMYQYTLPPPIIDQFPNELNRFASKQDPQHIFIHESFSHAQPQSNNVATIVIAHGWGEHSGRYDEFTNYLVLNGYNVYRFDWRGRGKSSGQVAYFDLQSVHRDLEQVFTERLPLYITTNQQQAHTVFLFAHSMGGFIAHSYYMFDQGFEHLFSTRIQSFKFGGIISSAAALAFGDDVKNSITFPLTKQVAPILARLLPSLPVQSALSPQYLTRNSQSVQNYIHDPLVYKGPFIAQFSAEILDYYNRIEQEQLMKHVNTSLLILTGTKDMSVSPQGSYDLYEQSTSRDKTLKRYEGWYHELIQEPERQELFSEIVSWLNNRV